MKRRNFAVWIGAVSLLLGTSVVSQAANTSTNGANESKKAGWLLKDIRTDAVQVRSAAAKLDNLAHSADAQWADYDQQWNEIKPSVEDMQIKLYRLDAMKTQLTPSEQKELAQSQRLIEGIQSRTRELRILMDQPGFEVNNARFKMYAHSLHRDAIQLEKSA